MNIVKREPDFRLIGRGLYSVPEAARMADVRAATLRRWLFGYRRSNRPYGPVGHAEIGVVQGHQTVSFKDLLEVRFVDAFRRHGVPWKVVRLAADKAAQAAEGTHAFLSPRFRTDGKRIYIESLQEAGEQKLLDLVNDQLAFHRVIEPSLFRDVVFTEHDEPSMWLPMWPKKRVVVDPARSFGRPIVAEGVPTEILAAAVRVEGDPERVARMFRVGKRSVSAAIQFEDKIAA